MVIFIAMGNQHIWISFPLCPGLSLFWSQCLERGLGLSHVLKFLCVGPAKLSGLQLQKGRIQEGYDADLVIWDPDATIQVRIVTFMLAFQIKQILLVPGCICILLLVILWLPSKQE